MQQLVGEVERVTDLVELLEKVDSQKTAEMKNNVVPGDSIEFIDCTIITPKDVSTQNCTVARRQFVSGTLLHGRRRAQSSRPGNVRRLRWSRICPSRSTSGPRCCSPGTTAPASPRSSAAILLHPPLPLVGVSTVMKRERQQNDSLVRGYRSRGRSAGAIARLRLVAESVGVELDFHLLAVFGEEAARGTQKRSGPSKDKRKGSENTAEGQGKAVSHTKDSSL